MEEPAKNMENQARDMFKKAEKHHLQSLERQLSAEEHMRKGEKDKAKISLRRRLMEDKQAGILEKNAEIINRQSKKMRTVSKINTDHIRNVQKASNLLSMDQGDIRKRKRERLDKLKNTCGTIYEGPKVKACYTKCKQLTMCDRAWPTNWCDNKFYCEEAKNNGRSSTGTIKRCSEAKEENSVCVGERKKGSGKARKTRKARKTSKTRKTRKTRKQLKRYKRRNTRKKKKKNNKVR
jgi:hypothetical protein